MQERANAPESTTPPSRKPSHDHPTAMSLATADSFTPTCSYCGENHTSTSCKTVTDPNYMDADIGEGRQVFCLPKEMTHGKRLQILWQILITIRQDTTPTSVRLPGTQIIVKSYFSKFTFSPVSVHPSFHFNKTALKHHNILSICRHQNTSIVANRNCGSILQG